MGYDKDGIETTDPSMLFMRYLPVMLVGCVGVLFSIVGFLHVRHVQEGRRVSEFERATQDCFVTLKKGIEAHLEILRSVGDLYAASEHVERHEFGRFVQNALRRHGGRKTADELKPLLALVWAPRVRHAERQAYVKRAKAEGLVQFQFVEMDPGGKRTRAGDRDEYFPAFYVEPLERNEEKLGFDILSHSAGIETVRISGDSGEMSATGRIDFALGDSGEGGFCVNLPIYRKNVPLGTVEQRRQSLDGFLVGIFRTEDLMEEVLSGLSPSGVDILIEDANASEDKKFLHLYRSRMGQGEDVSPQEMRADGIQWSGIVNVANREWLLTFRASKGCFSGVNKRWSWCVLVVGVMFTGLFGVYLAGVLGKSARTERIVAQRTSELSLSNQALAEAEKSAAEERKNFLSILDALPEYVYLQAPDHGIRFANRRFRELFGDPGDRPCYEVVNRRKEPCPNCPTFKVFDTKESQSWESKPFDGHIFLCHDMPYVDTDGTLLVLEIGLDIAERKRAEQELLKFKTTADQANYGVVIAELDGKLIYVNDEFAGMLDSQPSELIGKHLLAFHKYGQTPRVSKLDEELVQEIEIVGEETWFPSKDGTFFPTSMNAFIIRSDTGEPLFLSATVVDITDRKRADDELRRFKTISDQGTHGAAIVDLDDCFTYVNESFAQMHGRTQDEMIGQKFSICRNEEQSPEAMKMHEAVLRDGGVTSREVWHARKDGGMFPALMNINVVKDESGKTIFYAVTMLDISERKQAEEELQKAVEDAEFASRAKSQFLANMSHEIRTPMNGIIGMTDLALTTDLTPEQREYLSTVRASADSLLVLISDLLDISRIEARKLEILSTEFELRDVVGKAAKTLALLAEEKRIGLVCRVAPDTPDTLIGDPGRLGQILLNLIGNAVKFTERGEIVVRVRIESLHKDEISLHFSVSDTGIGIPEDKMKSIFEAFAQAHDSTSLVSGGTGLGLAISSQLVDMMKGRIWVESEFGKGSVFHFTARFGQKESLQPDLECRPSVRHTDLRVLIADDSSASRDAIEEQLVHWGMRSETTDCDDRLLEIMQQGVDSGNPFAIVMIDAYSSEETCFDLVRKIGKDSALSQTKALVLISARQARDIASFREAGASACLTKPVMRLGLMRAIKETLEDDVHEVQEKPDVPAAENCVSVGGGSKRALRILLAEDNAVNRVLAVGLLEKSGHCVCSVGNGREAIAAFDREQFDVVIMDIRMPVMSGLEAAAAIRDREKNSDLHTPILAMTAYASEESRQKCYESGMDGCLVKPITASQLYAAIDKVLMTTAQERVSQEASLEESSKETSIDTDALMRRVRNDAKLLGNMITRFRDTYPDMLSDIRRAIADQDVQRVKDTAHKLKGAVGNFSAWTPYEAVLRLEEMGKAGDLVKAEAACDTVQHEIDMLFPALKKLLKRVSGTEEV